MGDLKDEFSELRKFPYASMSVVRSGGGVSLFGHCGDVELLVGSIGSKYTPSHGLVIPGLLDWMHPCGLVVLKACHMPRYTLDQYRPGEIGFFYLLMNGFVTVEVVVAKAPPGVCRSLTVGTPTNFGDLLSLTI